MFFINTPPELHMHRGDTYTIEATIYCGNNLTKQLYTLMDGDELYFAILEPNQCWENAIIKKKYTTADFKISLDPKDTMCLIPGLYYYQIKLRNKGGEVCTLCNRSNLYILE